MSVPIPFSDIGKPTRDLLSKDFITHGFKLEAKTTAPNGVSFKVAGIKDAKSGLILGDLETKWANKANGVTFTQAWTTANQLKAKVEFENNLAKGLKVDLDTMFVPSTGAKNAIIKADYKQPSVHSVATLDVFKTQVAVDTVIGREGFLAGAEVGYDVANGLVSRYNTALGYVGPDYTVNLHATNSLSMYTASYYHCVSPAIETGAKATWDTKNNNVVGLEVGTRYRLDPDTAIKAKVNNFGVLAMSYTQALKPGVKVTLAAQVDTTRFEEDVHRVGVAFTLEN
ncbi:hypothetical protein BZG36_04290 [Bifiguratus adelaidae]|uniref:Mitochondrial outer membrane protein porin n=1 Tax=Bifiguratus adelaidae TaxID=1938954 RepID=A0A261XVE5_9FUNG|nr:hypothetical protein BZG36_04290 [Bifiguratus adelaidae]